MEMSRREAVAHNMPLQRQVLQRLLQRFKARVEDSPRAHARPSICGAAPTRYDASPPPLAVAGATMVARLTGVRLGERESPRSARRFSAEAGERERERELRLLEAALLPMRAPGPNWRLNLVRATVASKSSGG